MAARRIEQDKFLFGIVNVGVDKRSASAALWFWFGGCASLIHPTLLCDAECVVDAVSVGLIRPQDDAGKIVLVARVGTTLYGRVLIDAVMAIDIEQEQFLFAKVNVGRISAAHPPSSAFALVDALRLSTLHCYVMLNA